MPKNTWNKIFQDWSNQISYDCAVIVMLAIMGMIKDAIDRKDFEQLEYIGNLLYQTQNAKEVNEYLKKHPDEVIIP